VPVGRGLRRRIENFWLRLTTASAHKSVVTRAILFGSNTHRIVQRRGLRLRPHWGSSQRSLNSLAGEGRVNEGKRKGGEGREQEGGREARGGCFLLNSVKFRLIQVTLLVCV